MSFKVGEHSVYFHLFLVGEFCESTPYNDNPNIQYELIGSLEFLKFSQISKRT
jgi:hypothetical protein